MLTERFSSYVIERADILQEKSFPLWQQVTYRHKYLLFFENTCFFANLHFFFFALRPEFVLSSSHIIRLISILNMQQFFKHQRNVSRAESTALQRFHQRPAHPLYLRLVSETEMLFRAKGTSYQIRVKIELGGKFCRLNTQSTLGVSKSEMQLFKKSIMKWMDLKNFFCLRSNLSNDNIISV